MLTASAQALSPKSNFAPSASRTDVVLLMSRSDRTLFFPQGWSHVPFRHDWLDTEKLSSAEVLDRLNELLPKVVVTGWNTPMIPSAFTVQGGGSIEYISHATGSVRHVVTRAQIAGGLSVSNWASQVAPQVAEHALLLVLAALRQLAAWRPKMEAQAHGQTTEAIATRSLYGRRVSIYGFGAVARQLVALLHPFGVELAVFSSGVPASFIAEHGAKAAPCLSSLCTGADVLVVCEALTPSTRGSLNSDTLTLLPRGAVLVNVARGEIIDERALANVAKNGALRLGLDVFCVEPVPLHSPLWTVPNAILSPHVAGPTQEQFADLGAHALDNVQRYLTGEKPAGLVTTDVFDRTT